MHNDIHDRPLCRIGAVRFLNSKPLTCGLEDDPAIEIIYDVPSRMPVLLSERRVDVALVPVVDLSTPGRRWQIVSDACIGCDGETLTVRVFSRIPPDRVSQLWVDTDSHTSIALARLLWHELHGRDLDIHPLADPAHLGDCDAILLIGDKVVATAPYGYTYRTDLGGAWKALTGLPFVFAVWAASDDNRATDLSARLSSARDLGVARAHQIADKEAPKIGWPIAVARAYLTRYLCFTLTRRHREGMHTFLELLHERGIVESQPEFTCA